MLYRKKKSESTKLEPIQIEAKKLLALYHKPGQEQVLPSIAEVAEMPEKFDAETQTAAMLAHIVSLSNNEAKQFTQSPLFTALLSILLGSQLFNTAAAQSSNVEDVVMQRGNDSCYSLFQVEVKQFENTFFDHNKELVNIESLIRDFVTSLPKEINSTLSLNEWHQVINYNISQLHLNKTKEFKFPVMHCPVSLEKDKKEIVEEPFADFFTQACTDNNTNHLMINTTQSLLDKLASQHHLDSGKACQKSVTHWNIGGGIAAGVLALAAIAATGCYFYQKHQRRNQWERV